MKIVGIVIKLMFGDGLLKIPRDIKKIDSFEKIYKILNTTWLIKDLNLKLFSQDLFKN